MPQHEIDTIRSNFTNQFIDIFKTILPLRYLPHRSDTLLFLFSGGVDSLFVTLVSAMVAHKDVDFVLVNVSFSETGKVCFLTKSEAPG